MGADLVSLRSGSSRTDWPPNARTCRPEPDRPTRTSPSTIGWRSASVPRTLSFFGGVGETTDSVIVWLPKEETAFISNLLGRCSRTSRTSTPCEARNTASSSPIWPASRRYGELRPEVLITGRGEPIRGAVLIDAALERLYGAVDYVHQQVLAGLNGDSDAYSLAREIQLPDHLRVGEGYGRVSWAARTIWESYLGRFHHRSTTELYHSTPAPLDERSCWSPASNPSWLASTNSWSRTGRSRRSAWLKRSSRWRGPPAGTSTLAPRPHHTGGRSGG